MRLFTRKPSSGAACWSPPSSSSSRASMFCRALWESTLLGPSGWLAWAKTWARLCRASWVMPDASTCAWLSACARCLSTLSGARTTITCSGVSSDAGFGGTAPSSPSSSSAASSSSSSSSFSGATSLSRGSVAGTPSRIQPWLVHAGVLSFAISTSFMRSSGRSPGAAPFFSLSLAALTRSLSSDSPASTSATSAAAVMWGTLYSAASAAARANSVQPSTPASGPTTSSLRGSMPRSLRYSATTLGMERTRPACATHSMPMSATSAASIFKSTWK
mmetsp:Transcript_24415/g.71854  ORF Transcript_24415/g.71854 Transcript_24415/m.71854 type:complete len:275 (+) Transcript_24415:372-1196(+)